MQLSSTTVVRIACVAFLANAAANSIPAATIPVIPGGNVTPGAINNLNQIVGTYTTIQNAYIGFLWKPGAAELITINPIIHPTGVNDLGVIVGFESTLGFIRSPKGTYSQITFPGASSTIPVGINDFDEITGYYTPQQSEFASGFSRDAKGDFKTVNFPGARSTTPSASTIWGEMTGAWVDQNAFSHGFLYDPVLARFESFDVPNSEMTYANAIDVFGDIIGSFKNEDDFSRGFIRDVSGKFFTFTMPNAENTSATGINDLGEIVGYFNPVGSSGNIGFLCHWNRPNPFASDAANGGVTGCQTF
jgi:uncharacterized membrane protein